MKIFDQIKKACLLIAVFAVSLTACNKLELDPTPNPAPSQGTTPTLATLLDDPSFSLLKALVTKAGLMPVFATPSVRYTLFAPDDAAITASLTPILPPGVTPAMYIASLDAGSAKSIVQYHAVPQVIPAASIPTTFPNFQYPSLLNPAPSVSALLRLTTFPSVRSNGAWVNNVPIVGTDIQAVNGVMHKVARIVMPPSKDLWTTINLDPELTYLKAAINRADSGVVKGARLVDAISIDSNSSAIASNLTLFAPNDAAMKAFITGAITLALINQGLDPATAQGQATFLVATYGTLLISNPGAISPALAVALNPTTVKGLIAYHILSSQSGTYGPPGIRVFSVNLPTSATAVKTLLNSAVSIHPGVTVQAAFVSIAPGVSVVSSATVKGLANATASNIVTMDVHCVNGVIHKIDQALVPQ
jgi:uncharacterized surface protein with fasciclin (FAS1) repeats